ncbi:MAG: methionyl-tRNA formyltransferase [Pirellulaceae bacterium]|nr:methionyl-tRNA formyltransferase [Pirellulaceae bacterium]
MRIVVLGTGPFAVPSVEALRTLGHDIPLVVTRPVPASLLQSKTGSKLPNRPVADWAARHNLPLWEPPSINDTPAIERLRELRCDLLFVCDYGQILSADCLSSSRLGGINLHGSLLPRHRGAAPVQWSLLCGDKLAGVTVIHMTPRLDSGPAISIRATAILPDETAGELEPRLAVLGVQATVEAVDLLEDWDGQSPIGQRQDTTLMTRARRFSKQDGQLDFRLPAEYLVRLIRACQPWPGTFAELLWPGGKRMRLSIKAARYLDSPLPPDSKSIEAICTADNEVLGHVWQSSSQQLGLDWAAPWNQVMVVRTGRGLLAISRLQPSGKRDMTVAEFLRGHPLQPGTRFELPTSPLAELHP